MPELPEVQTVVDTLTPILLGRTITRVKLLRRDILSPPDADLPALLRRRNVSGITRRGKRIIFRLDNGQAFFIHLGMTGRLTVEPPAAARLPHTHLIISCQLPVVGCQEDNPTAASGNSQLATRNSIQLRFRDPRRFGGIWWLGHAFPDENMGPEPLKISPDQLARRLDRTTRAIKNALLDQRVVAGLGNIYVDEALFTARIHPLTPANALTLPQVRTLNRAIKLTLRRALRHRGSTLRDYVDANGTAGAFQSLHRVYDREAQPCRTCGIPVQRIVLGGRSTHFCPSCQIRTQDENRARGAAAR